jgi:hypothetical protein
VCKDSNLGPADKRQRAVVVSESIERRAQQEPRTAVRSLDREYSSRGEIERELQGTSPIEAFKDFLDIEQHIPNPVPHGERLERLNEIAHRMGISQSKAEKARAAYNRFLKVANQTDPPDD